MFRYEIPVGAVSHELRRLHMPHVVEITRYFGQQASPDLFDSVIAFTMFYFLALALVAVLLTLTGLPAITAVSGADTSLANVGPGLGAVSAGLLIGRLEILPVLILFTATFWRA